MKPDNCFDWTDVNQRENNEDFKTVFSLDYGENQPITVLAIADGMGGHDHGEDVSRQAVLKIQDFLDKSVDDSVKLPALSIEGLQDLLFQSIDSANTLVQRMIQANGWDKAGSTIVVAAVWQNQVVAVNLGDSPLYHYSTGQRQVVRVTQDHSVPGILAQANLITEEMARYHERRGQLEFFLGAPALPQPKPVYQRRLEPGDLLLLCSDGISGLLTLKQIETILQQSETSLEEKAHQLISTSRAAGETDNQTLILWRYDDNFNDDNFNHANLNDPNFNHANLNWAAATTRPSAPLPESPLPDAVVTPEATDAKRHRSAQGSPRSRSRSQGIARGRRSNEPLRWLGLFGIALLLAIAVGWALPRWFIRPAGSPVGAPKAGSQDSAHPPLPNQSAPAREPPKSQGAGLRDQL